MILTKLKKKNSIGISVFGYKNEVKYPIYVLKNPLKKNMLIILTKRR